MSASLTLIIRAIQETEFKEELEKLKGQLPIKKSSSLSTLNPFLDEHQIMRIGGRLEQSPLSFEAKHPAILPHNHSIVKLLLQMLHEDNHHCGPQALLAVSRSRFWITNGKTATRSTVHKCIRCTRAKPRLFSQLMGNLPASRVTPARPFITSGVDYFGPVWIHHKIRGKRPDKAYIAVFCCFATKAIHMEVVSNLSTEAFIAALKRFIGRRGHCKTLYCDNATNFVGANNKLTELRESLYSDAAQEKLGQTCSNISIEFKFIPPRAPHFGGLWEAAVKSAKHLLIRSTSAASLTYEELETVIIEIEAILNSRPLIPISSNIDDFQALTPGHFLVGEPLTTPIDANAQQTKLSLNARWRITTEIKHKFWKEWTLKYLHELQERGKWKTPSPNITEGMMVILKEDNVPVLQWPLGRVTRVYKGDDGLVRVIDVKTENGTFKRPIHRLAPLFNDFDIEHKDYEKTAHQNKRKNAEQSVSEPSQQKRKIVSYSSTGMFITIILSLLLLPLLSASPINVTEFTTKPGLYFEGIGSTQVVTGTWKIVIYYDLTPIWKQNKVLEDGITSFSTLCGHVLINDSCKSLSEQLWHTWRELVQESDLLTPTRSKRAALNIVGNVAHALFGVLDSEYAEEMSQTISKVKEDEEYLYTLTKTQTSVIDSTINIIKQNENNTMTRFKEFKEKIYGDLKSITDENSDFRQAQYLTSLAIQLNMLALDLQRIQTELITALTHTNQGFLSPLILTPHQFKQEISKIKGHLPAGQTLPIGYSTPLELYKIMQIKGAVTTKNVIFVTELPLVNQEVFKLFKIIPIPTQINNTLVAIQPSIDFLAVNNHRDEYLSLSVHQFTQCTVIKKDNLLCHNLQVHIRRSSATLCEISLFNNKTFPQCNFEHIHHNISVAAMNQNNRWIYATTSNTELSAVCGGDIIDVQIKGSGILSILPSCTVKGNMFIIYGHEVENSTIHTSYATFGNITAIRKPAEITKIYEPELKANINLEQLTNLQNQLQNLKQIPTEIQHPASHSYTGHTALFLIIIIISIFITWRLKLRCKNNSAINITPIQPQPMPRHQISEI